MTDISPNAPLRVAYADRLRLVAMIVVTGMVLGPILRIVLYSAFHQDEFRVVDLALAIATGAYYDAVGLLFAVVPFLLAASLLRLRLLGRKWVRVPVMAIVLGAMCFNAIAEFFFFEEFNARYNHIALDYLIYPREVFVNIWDSYNVPLVAVGALIGGLLLAIPIARLTRDVTFARVPWRLRWRAFGASVGLLAVLIGLANLVPANASSDRIVSEVAQNGLTQLWRAFWTAHLDFGLYYHTVPLAEARTRAAEVLGHDVPDAVRASAPIGQYSMLRRFQPALPDQKYDVVVILEESFGSEFIGVLGHAERRTSPGFDRWSKEGTLLANLTATGNRTVRGMEGVLCSFPPLPGDSVVKRDHSQNVASVARVMQQLGARTRFFYGGFGIFDSMKPFILANGYEQFIEQPDYPKDAFRTIWGVADEWVLGRMMEEQLACKQKGERYCFTALTVSNHKPYYIPRGRIQELTAKPGRDNAVAYADWALANYLDKAKAAGLLDSTIVLVVGDHGARVYGSEAIPAPSYRVPALFLHPDPRFRGQRWDRLCSQVDLVPTLLSMAGIAFEAPFFGRDLIGLPTEGGRAFLQHNRDIGLLTDDTMVILGLQKKLYFYQRPGRDSDTFTEVFGEAVTPAMRAAARDATCVFQTAYELYVNERFRLR